MQSGFGESLALNVYIYLLFMLKEFNWAANSHHLLAWHHYILIVEGRDRQKKEQTWHSKPQSLLIPN